MPNKLIIEEYEIIRADKELIKIVFGYEGDAECSQVNFPLNQFDEWLANKSYYDVIEDYQSADGEHQQRVYTINFHVWHKYGDTKKQYQAVYKFLKENLED